MYGRLSRYVFTIHDRARWDADFPDDESTIELVAGFEGCRGVWMLLDEEASTQREAHYTLFSLWDTEEQAESVSQRAGSSMAAMLDAWGATLARPPESEVLLVEAGRAV